MGYVQWHEWAETMSSVMRQKACPGCGLFKVWAKRDLSKQTLSETAVSVFANLLNVGLMPDALADWNLTPVQVRTVAVAARWLDMRRQYDKVLGRRGAKQRRAMALLRSFLTEAQKAQLDRSRCFDYVGAKGTYRFWPTTGALHRVEQHGKRMVLMGRFCIHDEEDELPRADVTLGQLLMVVNDEEGFLTVANRTDDNPWQGARQWDGEHRRRVRRHRSYAQERRAVERAMVDVA